MTIAVWLFSSSVYSQIKIVDSISGQPLPSATIFLKGGKYVTTSNINGIIDNSIFDNLVNENDTITIQHIGYSSKNISLAELKKSTQIKLNSAENKLSDVVVISDKKYDYLVLKGYFRTFQAYDSLPKYFADGIVEYYIPVNGGSIKLRVIAYRVFGNKPLVEKLNQKTVVRYVNPARTPLLGRNTIQQGLSNDYTLHKTNTGFDIIKSDSTVGTIRFDSKNHIAKMYLDNVAPNKEIEREFLGFVIKTKKYELLENYQFNDSAHIGIKDLLNSSLRYNSIYFHKGKKKDDVHEAELIIDFYVMSNKYITKNDYKKVKKEMQSIYLKDSHHYDSEY